MLQTLAVLLVFQSLGEVISYSLHMPIPGPVIGMVLLVGYLLLYPEIMPRIQDSAVELLRHLSLLFVPACVGIIVHAHSAAGQWGAILTATAASTLLTITVTALVTKGLMRWQSRRAAASVATDITDSQEPKP